MSVVCAPERNASGTQRRGLFSSAPPFTRPGQPLTITNHGLGQQTPVQPPPNNKAAVPSWLLPAAVILAGSDVASGGSELPNLIIFEGDAMLLLLPGVAARACCAVLPFTLCSVSLSVALRCMMRVANRVGQNGSFCHDVRACVRVHEAGACS